MAKFHNSSSYNFPGFYDDEHDVPEHWIELSFVNKEGFAAYWQKYDEASQYIQDNIKDWQENCRWFRVNDCSYFYFLKNDDALLFKMMWC
jgi:hypothetical protein